MCLHCMLMRFNYTVLYRFSELLQTYKQPPQNILVWPCCHLLVLPVVTVLTARFSGASSACAAGRSGFEKSL